MLEPWNNATILPPPVNMFLSSKKVDISSMKHSCNNIIKILSKQSPLHKESALCSRFVYKYDRKFRNDIGYRSFRKVHTALKKYLSLNLLKDVEGFLSALPSETDDEKYLPTRQMLEYVMLRIITFSMIMLRVCVCSKQSAIFYLNRLKRGESHWMSLLPYALMSRLWSMCKVLLQHSTNWYSNLYPYLNILEFKGLQFLPENYTLPQDLEEWLDLKNIDDFGRFNWDQKKLINVGNDLLDDDDNDSLFDNILSYVNQLHKNESEEEAIEELKPLEKCNTHLNNIIEHGETVSRDRLKINKGELISRESYKMEQTGQGDLSSESFKVLLNTHNILTKKIKGKAYENKLDFKQNKDDTGVFFKQDNIVSMEQNKIYIENDKHSHMKVTNTVSLQKFIKTEEEFRNELNTQSLTAHLSLMQWHALKKALLKLCDVLTNRKIDKKFKKIWKEKCLDYK